MRQIVFDTETTGLDPSKGDRLVEIGGVELVNMIPTGNVYHCYLNPQRDMPEEAFRVHGLSAQFLADKPLFEHVVDEFLAFVGDATLVIHNAEFDMRFINTELARLSRPPIPMSQVIDTLALARRRFPGSPASLDALCTRFGIDNSRRTKHGALLDSEILAEVYAELTGGRQTALLLGTVAQERAAAAAALVRPRPVPLPGLLTPEEEAAHAAFVETLGPQALWHAWRAPEAIDRTAL